MDWNACLDGIFGQEIFWRLLNGVVRITILYEIDGYLERLRNCIELSTVFRDCVIVLQLTLVIWNTISY